MNQHINKNVFPTAAEDLELARKSRMESESYRLAYADDKFLLRDDLRAVRLQLEWLKPDLIQEEHQIESTVVIFGSARFQETQHAQAKLNIAREALSDNSHKKCTKQTKIAKNILQNSRFYNEARLLAQKITKLSLEKESNLLW